MEESNQRLVQWVRADDRNSPSFSAEANRVRSLLLVPAGKRDRKWLTDMLQWALQLEFATIPPYLTAMWTIKTGGPVEQLIAPTVLEEMNHMGWVCNLLRAVGEQPRIADPLTIPRYPRTGLPGGVLPGLTLQLERLSRELIRDVFMEVEQPACGPITYYHGQTYPSIGGFYEAIAGCIATLSDSDFSSSGQLTYSQEGFDLQVVSTVAQALEVIEIITVQGEGTTGSPKFGTGALDFAHYYRFGMIYYEQFLEEKTPGDWSYSGAPIDFPQQTAIYPMATIPASGYAESKSFNKLYTSMLKQLQAAWDAGGTAGEAILAGTFTMMGDLKAEAIPLLEREITPGGERLGPAFQWQE